MEEGLGRGAGQCASETKIEEASPSPSPLGDRETHLRSHYATDISAVHETYDHTGSRAECSEITWPYLHCGL